MFIGMESHIHHMMPKASGMPDEMPLGARAARTEEA